MRRGLAILGVALLGVPLWLGSPAADACSTSGPIPITVPTEAQVLAGAEVAFVGTAVGPIMPERSPGEMPGERYEVPYLFEVTRVDKGDVTDPYTIWAGGPGGGGLFEPGVEYRVFGYKYHGPRIRVSTACRSGPTHRTDQPPPYIPNPTTPTLPGGLVDLPPRPVPPGPVPTSLPVEAVVVGLDTDTDADTISGGAAGVAAGVAVGAAAGTLVVARRRRLSV